MTTCDICGHPPIRHVRDGNGWTCLVCLMMLREGLTKFVCTHQMKFKLSQSEREQAARASRESYPPKVFCAICFCTWEQHMGFLCPSGDDTFLPLLNAGEDYHA